MLLASEISCSRSNVLVPVSAWSSPAESVSRSRCSSAISDIVWSYSVRSSSHLPARAARIFSVSAADRGARVATLPVPFLLSAVRVVAALLSADFAIIAPSAAGSAAVTGACAGGGAGALAGAEVRRRGAEAEVVPEGATSADVPGAVDALVRVLVALVSGTAAWPASAAFLGAAFAAAADFAGLALVALALVALAL